MTLPEKGASRLWWYGIVCWAILGEFAFSAPLPPPLPPIPKSYHFYGVLTNGTLTHLGRYRTQAHLHRLQTNFILSNCCHVIQSDVPLTSETMVIWTAPHERVMATPPTTDTNPPVIASFVVRQAVIQDFPLNVPFAWSNYHGACFDPNTGQTVNRAIHLAWPTISNYSYTTWYTPSITSTSWQEFPVSSNLHPVKVAGIANVFVPVYPQSNRVYRVRANNNNGKTFP